MTAITIEIQGKANARNFIELVKNIKYVKNVSINDETEEFKPLTDDDWVRPGRPATDEEIEARCREYDSDESRYSVEEARELSHMEFNEWMKNRELYSK